MPGLPFFTANHVRGPLIKALRQRGRDVVRAVDLFGQENDDAELFAHAAREERIFSTCDEGIQAIAHDWLKQGRTDFRMIYCTMEHQQKMTISDLLEAIEDILRKPDAFAYPIEYVKPQRRARDGRAGPHHREPNQGLAEHRHAMARTADPVRTSSRSRAGVPPGPGTARPTSTPPGCRGRSPRGPTGAPIGLTAAPSVRPSARANGCRRIRAASLFAVGSSAVPFP